MRTKTNETVAVPALPVRVPLRHQIAARLVLRRLSDWRSGCLTMSLPDRSVMRLGDRAASPQVTVTVKNWAFFWRLLTAGDIGAGESYMAGEWECSDLVGLCRLFIEDQSMLDAQSVWTWTSRLQHHVLRLIKANTVRGSRHNVQRHYDLSNDLFRLFLDASMTYSCGIFADDTTSLEVAQQAKIDGICRQLALRPGLEVLEIGSGWGAFAMHAAQQYGCRVTSLTLSAEQLQLARERVRAAGLESTVDIRLCDYRQITGQFDCIVSIEMFEAVGYEHYGAFFGVCERLLRRRGRMFLQTITIPDQRFDAYRRDFDWTQKYIFPGSLLASVHAVSQALKRHTQLRIESLRDIGTHYARTLRCWRERFLSRVDEVRRLGFDDRFIRMWEYYLASCEASFAARYISNVQLVMARPMTPPAGSQ